MGVVFSVSLNLYTGRILNSGIRPSLLLAFAGRVACVIPVAELAVSVTQDTPRWHLPLEKTLDFFGLVN